MAAQSIEAAFQALAAGDWHAAHRIVQDDPSADAAWVHALLHRIEGDDANAGYWYRRAGKPFPGTDTDTEWRDIAAALGIES